MSGFQELCRSLEGAIHCDPARRGLCAQDEAPLCPGDLAAAAERLASSSGAAVLVTGFYIPHGDPPAAETDGITGTLMLGALLSELGRRVLLVSDTYGTAVLRAGLTALDLPSSMLREFPTHPTMPDGDGIARDAVDQWIVSLFDQETVSDVVAVERVGPAHNPTSLQQQRRTAAAPLAEFHERVPAESWDRCHNMGGRNISRYTGETHRLFDYARAQRPETATIGVGDGGNEIGMGKVPWEELCRRIPKPAAAATFCRVETDYNIVGGTSDWGAFALAIALAARLGTHGSVRTWNRGHTRGLLETIVQRGPAVDGVTGRRQATVDGLAFDDYFDVIEGLRRLVL